MFAMLPCLLFLFGAPSEGARYVVEPRMQSVLSALVKPPAGAPKGTKVEGVDIAEDHVVWRLKTAAGRDVRIELHHPSQARAGDHRRGPFSVRTTSQPKSALVKAALRAVAKLAGGFRWRARGHKDNPLKTARSRLYMKDIAGVRRATRAAAAWAPGDPTVGVEIAWLLQAAGLTTEAKAARARVQPLIAKRPAGTTAAETIALALLDQPLDQERVTKELGRSSGSACSLALVVDALRLKGTPDAALALVDRILTHAPTCREAHHHGTEITARKLAWPALLKRVEAAEASLAGRVDFTVQRATALRGLKRYNEARDLLEKHVRKSPNATAGLSQLTNLYNMTLSREPVFKKLLARYRANRDDIISGYLAGVMAHYIGKHSSCVQILEPLIKRFPGEPRVPMYAAISAFFMGEQAKAERLIGQAHAIAGAMDPDVYYCRAIIYREKNMPQAVKDIELFLEVAKLGWHSEGKIDRVKGELALMRRGIVPQQAEAHHRPEAPPASPQKRRTPTKDSKAAKDSKPASVVPPPPSDPPSSTLGNLAIGGLVLLLFGAWLWLRRRSQVIDS